MRQRERAVVKLISLSILAQQGVFIVQRRADQPTPEDLPVVGQDVQLPVRIDADLQAGVPKVRLVCTDGQSADSFQPGSLSPGA
jgi:hypothetical protein